MKEVPAEISDSEAAAKEYDDKEKKYNRELEAEKQRFMETKAQTADLNSVELIAARMEIRQEKEQDARKQISTAVGERFSEECQRESIQDVDHLLDEDFLELTYRAQQRYAQHGQQRNKKTRPQEYER